MLQLSNLLEKYNLTLDQLNQEERKTLFKWAEALKSKQLTPQDIKEHVAGLITALERDMASLDEPPNLWAWLFRRKRHLYLQARLKNYLMLQDFVTGPERAQKWIEMHLQQLQDKSN